jgi:hypothetical protein
VVLTYFDTEDECHAEGARCGRFLGGGLRGEPDQKADCTMSRSVDEVVVWVRDSPAKYKLHGHGQYNCQNYARALFTWA